MYLGVFHQFEGGRGFEWGLDDLSCWVAWACTRPPPPASTARAQMTAAESRIRMKLPLPIATNPKYDGGIQAVYGLRNSERSGCGASRDSKWPPHSWLQSAESLLTAVPTRLSGVEAPDVSPTERFP